MKRSAESPSPTPATPDARVVDDGEAEDTATARPSGESPSPQPEQRRPRWDTANARANASPHAPQPSPHAPQPPIHVYPRIVRSGFSSATICIEAHKGQDHFLTAEDFRAYGPGEDPYPLGLFAICDGHGDSRVAAEFASVYIQETLRVQLSRMSKLEKSGVALLKLLRDTVSGACPAFRSMFPQSWLDCGSTICLLVCLTDTLLVANLGDSRAVLVRHGAPYALTRDQKPETEAIRVQRQGGFVSSGRVPRVGGILAMSRAIGDGELKGCGLSAEPECLQILLEEGDSHAVIASDGLFDSLSNEEVARTVAAAPSPMEACERLAAQVLARERWPDDITITCVDLARFRAFRSRAPSS
eukprot:tig00021035_g17239.t1